MATLFYNVTAYSNDETTAHPNFRLSHQSRPMRSNTTRMIRMMPMTPMPP